MVDYEFNANKVCNVNEFYFTAIAVLGNGVKPAFKEACLNFHKIGVFQDMMLDLREYMQQFEGGNSMGANQIADEPITDFEEGQEAQQEQVDEEPKQEEHQEVKDEPNYKDLLEKAEADYGRTIADLTKERDELNAQLTAYEEDKKALEEAHKAELDAMKEELDALKKYKKDIEDAQRKEARERIVNQMATDFPELSESEDYKKLLENEDLNAEDLENKAYAIVGKLEREKRGNKRKPQVPQSNRVPITTPTNKDRKANSPYGGLLIK